MRITNELGLPEPFVAAARSNYKPTPKRYSVTTLTKGVRQSILERRHNDEITQDAADMVWAIFGSAVHDILRRGHETETQLKEEWVSAELPNGYTLSGIFDLYDDATGTVIDYKTVTAWKVVKDEWDDYRNQVLAYCWILRQMGFDAHRGQIVAMLKDHSKNKAKTERDYPKHPVYIKTWNFGDRDFEEIEKQITERFAELEAAEKLPDDQLPLCTAEERWSSGDVWAVTKVGTKRAAKLHNNEADAKRDAEYRTEQTGKKHEVQYRPGKDARCLDYCSCHEFCDHYQQIKEAING